jgi:hypothetical protein
MRFDNRPTARAPDRPVSHRLQQLSGDRGINPRAAEGQAPGQPHHKVWFDAAISHTPMSSPSIAPRKAALAGAILEGDIAAKFFAAVLAQPNLNKLLSSDHFSVDGTLIEAWASMKSVKPKDGSGDERSPRGLRKFC